MKDQPSILSPKLTKHVEMFDDGDFLDKSGKQNIKE